MPDVEEEIPIKGMIRNTFYNSISSIIGRLGGLIFTVLIARILLPELFGIYSLVLGIVLLFLGFIDPAINSSTIKYVSEAFNKHQHAKARTYFGFWLNFKIIIAGFLSAILLLFAKPISIYIFNKPLITLPLQVGAIYLFASSVLTSLISLAYSVKKVRYVVLEELILQTSKVILVAFFIFLLKSNNISLIFLILLFSSIISVIFLFNLMKTKYAAIIVGKKVTIDKRKLFKFFFFMLVISIASSIFVHIDTILLGILVPATEFIAFYQVALTIVQSATILVAFSSNVFLPFFTQLKGKSLEREFQKVFKYAIIISVPSVFGLIFIAQPFIKLIFGEEYLAAVLPLSILSFLLIESVTSSLFSAVFMAKDKLEYQMKVLIATSIFYVILSFILIKAFAAISISYSIIGASIAVLLSRYSAFFSLAFIVNKKFRIKPQLAPIYKSFISAILMLLLLIGIDRIFNLVFPFAIIEVILGVLFYFIFMWIIKGITKEDLELFRFYKKKNI